MTNILDRANKVSYILKPLYNYVSRNESIVNTFTIKSFDINDAINEKIFFLNSKGYYDLANKEKNINVKCLINNLSKLKLYKINNKKIEKKYKDKLKTTCKEISWKNANRMTKLFKIIGNSYIDIRYIEYKIYYAFKKNKNNYIKNETDDEHNLKNKCLQ